MVKERYLGGGSLMSAHAQKPLPDGGGSSGPWVPEATIVREERHDP